jgi:hypothetical protein
LALTLGGEGTEDLANCFVGPLAATIGLWVESGCHVEVNLQFPHQGLPELGFPSFIAVADDGVWRAKGGHPAVEELCC